MFEVLISFLLSFRVYFRTRSDNQLEILALRHQIVVLQRKTPKPKLKPTDRRLWVWLSQCWPRWRSALLIVKPTTVVDWHRRGFRWYWTWKVRHGHAGRPSVAKETRELIRILSRSNSTWGAPRIHSELLKLGIQISEASVAKYMVRHRKPQEVLGKMIGLLIVSVIGVPLVLHQLRWHTPEPCSQLTTGQPCRRKTATSARRLH